MIRRYISLREGSPPAYQIVILTSSPLRSQGRGQGGVLLRARARRGGGGGQDLRTGRDMVRPGSVLQTTRWVVSSGSLYTFIIRHKQFSNNLTISSQGFILFKVVLYILHFQNVPFFWLHGFCCISRCVMKVSRKQNSGKGPRAKWIQSGEVKK